MTHPVVERIERFVQGDLQAGPFEDLALEAFAFQFGRSEPFRRLCQYNGVTPDSVDDWNQIPAIPNSAFRHFALHTAEPREVFRSSGTTSSTRSTHHHPFPDLYRKTIDCSFPKRCLSDEMREAGEVPILSLVPSRTTVPDSSLGFMVEHILQTWGTPESCVAFDETAVNSPQAVAWCAAQRDAGRPVLLIATAFALVQLFEEAGDDLRLPEGSIVFETGGFKGKTRELSRAELRAEIETRLAVPPHRVVREYGMTELTSQFYTDVLRGGDGDLFVELPWLRARIVDPNTLTAVTPGATGLVGIFDLANVGSAIHLMTLDMGRAEEGGFRLLGRAAGANLRGCSLTVEEMRDSKRIGRSDLPKSARGQNVVPF